MEKLPSEKLRRGWTWKTWTGLGAAVAFVAAVGVTALLTGPLASAAPEPTPTAVVPHVATCDDYRGGVCYTPEMEAAAAQQEQQIEADNAAKAAAAAAAAAQAAAQQAAAQRAAQQKAASSGSDRLPSGAVPPNIPGTTSPDSTACESSSVTSDGHGGFVCL